MDSRSAVRTLKSLYIGVCFTFKNQISHPVEIIFIGSANMFVKICLPVIGTSRPKFRHQRRKQARRTS